MELCSHTLHNAELTRNLVQGRYYCSQVSSHRPPSRINAAAPASKQREATSAHQLSVIPSQPSFGGTAYWQQHQGGVHLTNSWSEGGAGVKEQPLSANLSNTDPHASEDLIGRTPAGDNEPRYRNDAQERTLSQIAEDYHPSEHRVLSFQELLALDISTLTRKEKRAMEAHLSADEKNALRKARISAKLAGRPPWNTGKSHSEETRLRIAEATKVAMQRPEVLEKLRLNHYPKVQTEETREKIRQSVRNHYLLEKQVIQELLADTSGEAMTSALDCFKSVLGGVAARPTSVSAFAKLMPPGSLAKERLAERASSKLLLEHFSAASLKRIVDAAENVLARTETDSSGEEDVIPTPPEEPQHHNSIRDRPIEEETETVAKEDSRRKAKEEAHKQAIARAIREKWKDPEYRLRVSASWAKKQKKLKKAKEEAKAAKLEIARAKAAGKAEAKAKSAAKKSSSEIKVKRKVGRPRKVVPQPEQNVLLDQIKEQEVQMARRQTQRLAKLNVAKELVSELESVLSSLPKEADLRPEDVDMRQSIVEAEQLLTQARSRVRTLETPFPVDVEATKALPKASDEQKLQSAILMLNMDPLRD